MLRLSALALSAAAVFQLGPTAADDAWVRVRSPHFEVLSDAGMAPAREAALRLERLRGVLLRLFPGGEDVGRPISVLLLRSQGRFLRLIPREHAGGTHLGGFFLGGSGRDYAVAHLSPAQVRPFEAVEHEYAHLILNSSLLAQPVWVAEGLAELTSDAILEGNEARLGSGRPEYEETVRGTARADLEALLTVGYDSPEYRGPGDGGTLYAQAWALVRWGIYRNGLTGLRSYLDAIAAGRESSAAFAAHLGTLDEAAATLLEVPGTPIFRVAMEDAPDPPLETGVPTVADVEQRLGDVLLRGGHSKAALRRFERALDADPGHVASRTSLGGVLVRQGKWDAGREQLEVALEANPDNPDALLRLARLELGEALENGVALSRVAEERIVASLEIALARSPQLTDAALLLAGLRPQPYAPNIARLEPLFEQQPERTELARTLSALYLKLGDIPAARRLLEQARDAARSESNRYLASHLLVRLAGFRDSTAEVRGDLIHVKCRPDGSLLFTVSADPRTLKLEADSTRSFFVHGTDGIGAEARLLCGEQDRAVLIRYDPGTGTDPAASGRVLWMAFDDRTGPGS